MNRLVQNDVLQFTLSDAIIDLTLRGRQMIVTNQELPDLAPDLSTKGYFPEAWIRCEDGFKLLKDGGEDTAKRELLAGMICQCFDIPQVIYREHEYDGQIGNTDVAGSMPTCSWLSLLLGSQTKEIRNYCL